MIMTIIMLVIFSIAVTKTFKYVLNNDYSYESSKYNCTYEDYEIADKLR